jgi:hypothetical protein
MKRLLMDILALRTSIARARLQLQRMKQGVADLNRMIGCSRERARQSRDLLDRNPRARGGGRPISMPTPPAMYAESRIDLRGAVFSRFERCELAGQLAGLWRLIDPVNRVTDPADPQRFH